MWRVFVRSRGGNLFLASVGALYAVGSLAVLTWFVIDVWGFAGLTDFLLQLALVASAACGIWFLVVGLTNLGLRTGLRQTATRESNSASIQR
jgi:hypothetical protein